MEVLERGETEQPNAEAVTQRCTTCCCSSHHQYSLHYSGNKFKTLPGLNSDINEHFIAMNDQSKQVKCKMDSLERVIMSTQVNLDNLF